MLKVLFFCNSLAYNKGESRFGCDPVLDLTISPIG